MAKNKVRDWMTPNPVTVEPKTTLPEAHKIMKDQHFRRLPVVDHGRLIGIVTLGDVREAGPSSATSLSIFELNYLLAQLTVDKIMTRNVISVAPEAAIREAADLMLQRDVGALPVVEGDQLVGIITESDIFRLIVQQPEAITEGSEGS